VALKVSRVDAIKRRWASGGFRRVRRVATDARETLETSEFSRQQFPKEIIFGAQRSLLDCIEQESSQKFE